MGPTGFDLDGRGRPMSAQPIPGRHRLALRGDLRPQRHLPCRRSADGGQRLGGGYRVRQKGQQIAEHADIGGGFFDQFVDRPFDPFGAAFHAGRAVLAGHRTPTCTANAITLRS